MRAIISLLLAVRDLTYLLGTLRKGQPLPPRLDVESRERNEIHP